MRPVGGGTILTSLALGLAACGGHGRQRRPSARRARRGTCRPPGGPHRRGGHRRDAGDGSGPPAGRALRPDARIRGRAAVPGRPVGPGGSGRCAPRGRRAARGAAAAAEAGLKAAEADLGRTTTLVENGAVAPREPSRRPRAPAAARARSGGAGQPLLRGAPRPLCGPGGRAPSNLGDVVIARDSASRSRASAAWRSGHGGAEARPAPARGEASRPWSTASRSRSRPPSAPSHPPGTRRPIAPRCGRPARRPGLRAGLFARLLVRRRRRARRGSLSPRPSLVRRGGLIGLFVVSDGARACAGSRPESREAARSRSGPAWRRASASCLDPAGPRGRRPHAQRRGGPPDMRVGFAGRSPRRSSAAS